MFRDYRSVYDEFRKKVKETSGERWLLSQYGVDVNNFESVYQSEIKMVRPSKQNAEYCKLHAEFNWYKYRRPYFNVYPLIERKLFELSDEIQIEELVMPFPSIEVRTQSMTVLISDFKNEFLVIAQDRSGNYEAAKILRRDKLKSVIDSEIGNTVDHARFLTASGIRSCIYLAVGICMLSTDRSIVAPVVLNCHRRDNMTPAEIARYSAKAVNRTGRIGFEVGRDIERMKSTAHYRNGCFAKYYVTRSHECYPPNAESERVPIIKWRCGSVVNKNNLPDVPTGFKDRVNGEPICATPPHN